MSLYPKGTSAEKIVKTVLLILKSQESKNSKHLNIQNLMGELNGIEAAYIQELCAFWETLLAKETETKALALLTQKIRDDLNRTKKAARKTD